MNFKQQTLFGDQALANLTVSPGSSEAQTMTVTSGKNISELLPENTPVGSFVRMCLESNLPFSKRCFLIWRMRVTKSRRLIYRLAPSMRPTADNVFSSSALMPTLTATQRNNKKVLYNKERGLPFRSRELGDSTRNYSLLDWMFYHNEITFQDWENGSLNPIFAEWFMGFPMGWTDVELHPSETPLSQVSLSL